MSTILTNLNYLRQSSPSTAEVCETLRKLIFTRTDRTWNNTYQKPYEQVKSVITIDLSMKAYNTKTQLHLETDVSWVRLGAGNSQRARNVTTKCCGH